MATSNGFTYQVDKDKLFAATVQIIREADYAVSEVDNTSKKIVYCVDRKGAFGGRFEATIFVRDSENAPAPSSVLTMKVVGLHNPATGSAANYRKFEVDLISFIVTKLSERQFQVATSTTKIAYKEGKRGNKGWLVLIVILVILAAASRFGAFGFLKALLPF